MRTTLLTIAILLLSITVSFSQGVKFGVYADPGLSWLQPEAKGVNRDGMGFSFSGGLTIDKYFQKNYALQTGVGIGNQGGKLIYDEESLIHVYDQVDTLPAGTSVQYKLNYISVPISLKLKTNPIGYFSYYALIGFTNQFRVKAKASSSDGSLNNDVIKKEISAYNLGYHFGIGVEYGLSEDTALTMSLVFQNGFIDITKNEAVKVNSRVLALRVGVIF